MIKSVEVKHGETLIPPGWVLDMIIEERNKNA